MISEEIEGVWYYTMPGLVSYSFAAGAYESKLGFLAESRNWRVFASQNRSGISMEADCRWFLN